jgi:pimeloyl-ACP methyl ester carboxylesterase
VSVAGRLADELSARVVVVPEAKHLPNAEHPRCFNRAVLEFLDAPNRRPTKVW